MNIVLVNPPNCGRSIPEEEYGITSLKQIFRGEPLGLEELAGKPEVREMMHREFPKGASEWIDAVSRRGFLAQ